MANFVYCPERCPEGVTGATEVRFLRWIILIRWTKQVLNLNLDELIHTSQNLDEIYFFRDYWLFLFCIGFSGLHILYVPTRVES